MDLFEKLKILTDAAKYDVACTSSGVDRQAKSGGLGSVEACGICHTFAADGRCVSLLKVLMTNKCAYDCRYCVNRRSNQTPRAEFFPRELADLTISFYRRNYIEGLFLSSGVLRNPDDTCERMLETLRILREDYGFCGYIHAKAIPGADRALIEKLGLYADRMSVNIELPSKESLSLLAPDKSKISILKPMGSIRDGIRQNKTDLIQYRHAPKFVPAGQSTQMIVGATPDTDYRILNLAQGLYRNYGLKRVFYSAYLPVVENSLLPSVGTKPPLLREHRLYQADWLLRFYGFSADELLDEKHQTFNPYVDPKCNWALNHMELFPIEVNRSPKEMLLRVPGIGVTGVKRILTARKSAPLGFEELKKLGVVLLKRAQYFITCGGKAVPGLRFSRDSVLRALLSSRELSLYARDIPWNSAPEQLSFFGSSGPEQEELKKWLTI